MGMSNDHFDFKKDQFSVWYDKVINFLNSDVWENIYLLYQSFCMESKFQKGERKSKYIKKNKKFILQAWCELNLVSRENKINTRSKCTQKNIIKNNFKQ